ncbi:hypothetical protein [Helicobacter sp. 13S00482-2]|uniref:hypothetical protein n=1 Tax=Helicobacter sp. 13S00482-2 TaxID=1476200 RepID=UPI0015D9BD0D|nr:hypothetical protein [Helicobacter sp. 13S00482-2]
MNGTFAILQWRFWHNAYIYSDRKHMCDVWNNQITKKDKKIISQVVITVFTLILCAYELFTTRDKKTH